MQPSHTQWLHTDLRRTDGRSIENPSDGFERNVESAGTASDHVEHAAETRDERDVLLEFVSRIGVLSGVNFKIEPTDQLVENALLTLDRFQVYPASGKGGELGRVVVLHDSLDGEIRELTSHWFTPVNGTECDADAPRR